MIVLATDYGCCSPYQAQLITAIKRYTIFSHTVPEVLSLFSDLPKFRPDLAAYLLPQYFEEFPADSVLLFVVDPGVGSEMRQPLLVRVKQLWIVCAGDDLLRVFASRHLDYQAWRIVWRPENLSLSFHGRDLFAPVAASISIGEWDQAWYQELPPLTSSDREKPWPSDYNGIVYIDGFGNAMTGIRAEQVSENDVLQIADIQLHPAEVFSRVAVGQCFFYRNANGLLEIAANQDSAARILKLSPGQSLRFLRGE